MLQYHLVRVVKYRRTVFYDMISNRVKETLVYITPNYNITLEEWNQDKNHVPTLFKAHPNTEINLLDSVKSMRETTLFAA